MKLISLAFALISSMVIAEEVILPLENVEVFASTSKMLSVQNFSLNEVKLDIYGDTFNIPATSGLKYACNAYTAVELQVDPQTNNHSYFEVPCPSKVVINQSFTGKENNND